MRDALIVSLLSLVPRKLGSRTLGRVARSPASRWLVRAFVRAYQVDLSEAAGTLDDYPTLSSLFTRRLRDGLRPVSSDPDAIVSPVDGVCAYAGLSRRGRIPLTPRRSVALGELCAEPVEGERDVAVLYLSPRDYHRVHVPREGTLKGFRYVPGTLWPVFPAAVRRVQDLFARNERMVVDVQTDRGPLTVVLVGAFGVGRIEVTGIPLTSNAGAPPTAGTLDRPALRGDELGVFHLGSTVVLVAPPGRWRWSVAAGDPVRVGQKIGGGVPLLMA